MGTVRLTAAQALVRFLTEQYVQRDGIERRFFAGCFGIFGHGNVAGVGQALQQYSADLPYYQARNEQELISTAEKKRRPGAVITAETVPPRASAYSSSE